MSDFKEWYENNKESLSQARKQRYATDPVYRETAKARAEDYRKRTREQRPQPLGLSIANVCAHLDISDWTLNKWRNQNYYPEPTRVNGKPVFQHKQLELLGMIKQFFEQYPKRAAAKHRDKLDQIVSVVFHNWS